ncbi:MAG: hypothetical protein ACREAK_04980 [Nitrosarchaeum sp.]
MARSTKIILLVLGIIVGIMLTFGTSDQTLILKEKTQTQKDFFKLIAHSASFVSIAVLVLTLLKKIPMRPTWSYFVVGVSATFGIIHIGILTIFPHLLD